MRKRFYRLSIYLGWILAGLLSGPAWAAEPTILVLGDSLSSGYGMNAAQGWVSLLQRRLTEAGYPQRVVNASISGDTSRGGLARLPAALEQHRPDIVILELGGNDGLRALPLKALEENLMAMIELSRKADAQVILAGMRIPPNYGPGYAERFHALYSQLAERYRLPLIPFLLEGVALDARLMQSDGIHPNVEAQARIVDNVWPVLEPLLKRVPPLTDESAAGSLSLPLQAAGPWWR